jgi:glucokinase
MSGLRVGVSNLAGTILATHSADIPIGRGPDEVLTLLEQEFDSALAEAGRSRDYVLGIGVGIPGRTELETAPGLGAAGTRPWSHFPIERRLRHSFGDVTVLTDRGVSLLAIAEQRAFHPDADVVLGVKVGTVIECGIVVGGSIVRGGAHLAGEIGHTPVTDRDVRCVCGNRGCLNAVAGGAALARELAEAGLPVQTTRDVARLALEGVVPAAQAVRESGRNIGQVLGGAINLLNPDVIVVWGYLADAGEQLFAGIRETLYRYGVPAATEHVQVERARLGDDAGIRGAATSVIEEILQPQALDRFVRRTAAPV